jgi:hypothetical protein
MTNQQKTYGQFMHNDVIAHTANNLVYGEWVISQGL